MRATVLDMMFISGKDDFCQKIQRIAKECDP